MKAYFFREHSSEAKKKHKHRGIQYRFEISHLGGFEVVDGAVGEDQQDCVLLFLLAAEVVGNK